MWRIEAVDAYHTSPGPGQSKQSRTANRAQAYNDNIKLRHSSALNSCGLDSHLKAEFVESLDLFTGLRLICFSPIR